MLANSASSKKISSSEPIKEACIIELDVSDLSAIAPLKKPTRKPTLLEMLRGQGLTTRDIIEEMK